MRVRKQNNKFKKRSIYVAIVIAAIAAVVFGRSLTENQDKTIIRTAKVDRGTVTSSVSANGVLQPLTTVEVKSNVGGQIIKLAVDEGDTVKAGQLIAKVDPSDTLTAYDQSAADLAASASKVNQARQTLSMQHTENAAAVMTATQGLASARAKLLQAEMQAKIQPSLTTSSIAEAKSNLASAQASLRQTKTALTPQKIAGAQSAYDQAKSSFQTASSDLKRQKDLLAKGFVATSAVEVSQDKYNAAKAQLDSATNKLQTVNFETDQDLMTAQAKVDQASAALANAKANSVQDSLKRQDLLAARAAVSQAQAALQSARAAQMQDQIHEGDIIQANAQVKRSEATLKNAKTQLGYTTITAPSAGIVTKKYVEAGSIVTAGKSSSLGTGSGVAIVDIADTSEMLAVVDVDETDIAKIEVGQLVEVTVQAYPDELFEGKVTKIAPQSVTDQNVTTIPVTVQIDMPDARLKPGMNVSCDFIMGKVEDALKVPNEAIKETDNGYTVDVMKAGKPVTRKVEIGLVGSSDTEIKSGLKEGDEVITARIEPTSTTGGAGGSQSRPGGGMGGVGGFGGGGGGGGMRRGG